MAPAVVLVVREQIALKIRRLSEMEQTKEVVEEIHDLRTESHWFDLVAGKYTRPKGVPAPQA